MQERSAALTRSAAVDRFERRDWLAAVILFAASLAIRVPFRSHFAYHWDSALFALAIEHYNVSLGQPHLPGFFLYVMLGRIVNVMVGDPHASLVWMSVFAGAALSGLGYLLATASFGRDCGLATGCLLASSPLCWFQSEVALTTIVDSALVMATVLVCWRAMGRGGGWNWVIAMAVMLAVVAGVRPQTAPVLCPLWLYSFWKFPARRWRRLVVGLSLVGVCSAAWFIPMIRLSGGIGAYLGLYPARARLNGMESIWGAGMREALAGNILFVVGDCWTGLSAAALLGTVEFVSWLRSSESRRCTLRRQGEQLRFIMIWLIPMFVFGVLTVVPVPGHILNYFPGIVILVGLALRRLIWRTARYVEGRRWKGLGNPHRFAVVSVIAVVTLVNIAVFLLPPRQTAWLRVGLPLTAGDIHEHDRRLGRWFQEIRSNYRPDQVMICHYRQYFSWGFRLFEYHLPEYENWLLTSDSGIAPALSNKLWRAENHRVEFMDRFEPRAHTTLILVVPPGGSVDEFALVLDVHNARKWEIPDGAPLYTLTVGAE